jgi:hypothetical protein
VLQSGKTNTLIVKTRYTGKAPADPPVVQLSINGQVKSGATPHFNENGESSDSLGFQVNDAAWQHLELVIQDAAVKYDDTFRIAARSMPDLSVLVLYEQQPNPFIQAAFRANSGFRVNQLSVQQAPASWKDYNLVILNGLTYMDASLGKKVADALEQGQTICLFPGRTPHPEAMNEGMQQVADIHFLSLDTAMQAASALQQGSSLVRELFEHIPDNIQLPVANWHYSISAGLSANQESILSFRNGDPLLAQYTPSRGKLFVSAVAADLLSSNFPTSYFFTPMLYQMAMQSGNGSVYARTAGSTQPIWVSARDMTERNSWHLYGNGIDLIPQQQPAGSGINIYLDRDTRQPGFYQLANGSNDSLQIGLNLDKQEALLRYRDIGQVKAQWKGKNIAWMSPDANGVAPAFAGGSSFPFWKLCVLMGVIMLALETWLLARPASLVATH